MIGKISRPKTLAYRYLGCLLGAMVVNIFVGTAPAPAQVGGWGYAWYHGKCYKTIAPWGIAFPELQNGNLLRWLSAPNSACRKIPVTVSKSPFATRMRTDRDPSPREGRERGQANSPFPNLPRQSR